MDQQKVEEIIMTKLEGFSKVAVIKWGYCTQYHFSIYDDGNGYKVGDMVALSNNNPNAKIDEIISVEESRERYKRCITEEVIGKIDISAYEKRLAQRKEKAELKKELDKRKKEIREKLDDEYYASKEDVYAKMLKRYEKYYDEETNS